MTNRLEYNVTTMEGILQFQTDHLRTITKELGSLDNYLHEHPDNASYKLILKHRMLMKQHEQVTHIINGFLANLHNDTEPKQWKNDNAAYTLADLFIQDIQHETPEELTTHLLGQMNAYKITRSGPVQKIIDIIRGLIEAQGADPDELIHKRMEENNGKNSMTY